MPEQIWDAPNLPSRYLRLGGPTGAALPLLWAHSEYVKLQRSAADGKIFDLIEAAYDRYVRGGSERHTIEVWKFNRQVPTAACRHAPAHTSELSVLAALDERRMAAFDRYTVESHGGGD